MPRCHAERFAPAMRRRVLAFDARAAFPLDGAATRYAVTEPSTICATGIYVYHD